MSIGYTKREQFVNSEIWKWIKGFRGIYKISSEGRLKSMARNISMIDGRTYRLAEKIIEKPKRGGYKQVSLINKDGTYWYPLIHRLVLEAFTGPCPEGMECRHLNGKRWDNRVENLTWGTRLENGRDRILHGTSLRGESNVNAKLTETDIPKIRRLRKEGMSANKTAKLFGVSKKTILNIDHGKIWTHVP